MKILVSGGGTGGHIFPAVSIANEIRRRHPDAEIKFVGAKGRMEMERVPAAGYDIEGLDVAGFDRKRPWRNIPVVFRLLRSMRRAKRIVRDFKPDIAIGVGGYASGPTLKAAQAAGVPTLLQEQNSYAGVTNRMLASKAKVICTAYPDMERFFDPKKTVLTGNPYRAAIMQCELSQEEAKKSLGFDPAKPLVLVVGGSLGARTVNNAVAALLDQPRDYQLLWQTGKIYADECIAKAEGHADVHARAFISDMATAYRAADIVVSRAGAGTISELQLVGSCAVLVPSPNVAEDHQRKNALALSTRGAAVLVEDADAVAKLGKVLADLLANPEKRREMKEKISEMARPDSTADIVDIIEKIIADK